MSKKVASKPARKKVLTAEEAMLGTARWLVTEEPGDREPYQSPQKNRVPLAELEPHARIPLQT